MLFATDSQLPMNDSLIGKCAAIKNENRVKHLNDFRDVIAMKTIT
jgi:hypothetical protein